MTKQQAPLPPTQAITKEIEIKNDLGLHLRAAGSLVQLASRYRSDIFLQRGTVQVNAKSILSLLSLTATKGVRLKLIIQGPDAQEALLALSNLIDAGFVKS